MKSVYMSLPMKSILIDEIIRRRERMLLAAINLLNMYLKPVDSFTFREGNAIPENIAERLRTMSRADYILFAEGWDTDRMCRIERLCAEECEIAIKDIR